MITGLDLESLLIKAVFSGDIDEVQTLIIDKHIDVNQQSQSTRFTALHAAAHCGHADIVELLCNSGARVNCKDARYLTPLHYACRSKNEETVRVLLDYNAEINARDKNWQAALHVCATYNSVLCAQILIAHMQNIDVTDRYGRSALAYAAFSGNLQMVELLLENGANPNIHDKQERKPIHWASFVGYTEIIRILKKYGADINSVDKEHYTPLLVACASGKSEETIRLLIQLGADITLNTIHESSAFHLACLNGHDTVLKELLLNNYEMKSNSKGYHPIHYASVSRRGSFCLEHLISLGIDVNMKSNDGKTPLHITALHYSHSCAQNLICSGAKVNEIDNNGNTPLHIASKIGDDIMVSLLLDYSASIHIRDEHGLLPLGVAALNGHFECFKYIEYLLDSKEARKEYFETRDNFGRCFVHLAALSGSVDCLEYFLQNDCDPNSIDKSGNTPLHYACSGPYFDCIKKLIEFNAKLDIPNEFKIIPIMYACASDDDGQVVEYLIDKGSPCDVYDSLGYNCLHYASLQGNRDVLELLIDKCKNLEHDKNSRNLSPLHLLAYHDYKEAIEILVRYLTNLDVKENNGRTPLDLACFQGSVSSVECLMLNGASSLTYDSINNRTPIHAACYNGFDECIKPIVMLATIDKQRLLESRDKHGRTPLMVAVEQGHLNTIDYLIGHNIDLNLVDNYGCTSLHRAAALGYDECCNLLIKHGASPYIRDSNGLLPIQYAIITGHANLINIFMDFKYDSLVDSNNLSLLHYACFYGHSTCAETLFDYEDTIRLSINKTSFTLLHCVCLGGHESFINYLIIRFGDSLLHSRDSLGRTALHICALNDEIDCARLLIEHGCNLNELNNNYETPLMLTCIKNSQDMFNLLIEFDITYDQVDISGNTALHLALINNHEHLALELIERINNIDLLNKQNLKGDTPLHLASSNGFLKCVQLLLSKGVQIHIKNTKGHNALVSCAKDDRVANCLEILLEKFIKEHQIKTVSSLENDKSNSNLKAIIDLNANCTIGTIASGTTTSVNEINSSDSEF